MTKNELQGRGGAGEGMGGQGECRRGPGRDREGAGEGWGRAGEGVMPGVGEGVRTMSKLILERNDLRRFQDRYTEKKGLFSH